MFFKREFKELNREFKNLEARNNEWQNKFDVEFEKSISKNKTLKKEIERKLRHSKSDSK